MAGKMRRMSAREAEAMAQKAHRKEAMRQAKKGNSEAVKRLQKDAEMRRPGWLGRLFG